jgi:YidC/Oxa1 family membrane protein insertase
MDFRRLLLALSLSFIFIFVWQTIFMPPQTKDVAVTNSDTPVKTDIADVETPPQNSRPHLNALENKVDIKEVFNIKTNLLSVDLANNGTSISNLSIIEGDPTNQNSLKHVGSWDKNSGLYNVDAVEIMKTQKCNPCLLENGKVLIFDSGFNYNYNEENTTHTVVSAHSSGITKTTIIYDDSYVVDHVFSSLNISNKYELLWSDGLEPTEKNIQEDLTWLSVFAEDKKSYAEEIISDENDVYSYSNVGWAGIKTKYFIKAITNQKHAANKTNNVSFTTKKTMVTNDEDFLYPDISSDYGVGNESLYVYSYIGPIDTQRLSESKTEHLVQLFGFGWFIIGYLAKLILWLLTSLYVFIPNYGIICILFAFIIRLFTGPLTKQSFLSNQKMQTVQPKMKKLQEKYKDDQTKLSQATMELYKKEGVNPLGGCLPILVQMPLLIALFQVFRKTIEFRGAEFLPFWITDLSQPDIIIQLPFMASVPGLGYFFGNGLALLPIIMGVIMFLSMQMTAVSSPDPSAKFAMYFMNGFFILLFNTFPSGLNLYYTVYNILNFLQQRQLKKIQS